MPTILLAYYCALILVASIIGGMIPVWFQLTHRRMQFAVSFVAGVMLGIGVLHMLPHALEYATTLPAIREICLWLLIGMLVMFFIERFFSFHHHDVPDGDDEEHDHAHHDHAHDHQPQASHLSWSGAAFGLAFHSVLNGVALAAAVQCENSRTLLAGLGTFLVIVLHKPFDAMTISMLMGRSGWSLPWRHTINGLFSLAIPVGVLVFYFGLMPDPANPNAVSQQWFIACVMAFSAGTFLCISLSDLLPELQFHRHDRVMLSVALLLGLGVAYVVNQLEAASHPPHQRTTTSTSVGTETGR